jgi:hypothetical protein
VEWRKRGIEGELYGNGREDSLGGGRDGEGDNGKGGSRFEGSHEIFLIFLCVSRKCVGGYFLFFNKYIRCCVEGSEIGGEKKSVISWHVLHQRDGQQLSLSRLVSNRGFQLHHSPDK